MLEHPEYIKDLTDGERDLFGNELKSKQKSIVIGQIICFFFWFIGGHRFYLNQNLLGTGYFILIPGSLFLSLFNQWYAFFEFLEIVYAIAILVEVFKMRYRVLRFNKNLAKDISSKIKLIRQK